MAECEIHTVVVDCDSLLCESTGARAVPIEPEIELVIRQLCAGLAAGDYLFPSPVPSPAPTPSKGLVWMWRGYHAD